MGIGIGDTLSFNLNIKEPGFPQVSSPCWKCLSDERWVSVNSGEPPAKAPRLSTPASDAVSASDSVVAPNKEEEEVDAATSKSEFFEPGGVFQFLNPFDEASDEQQPMPMEASDAPEGADP
mmetsp:Transcript_2380/g.4132  ORF Transcript_2380/g.4132 Transcript_2380/m.4132 type:complete len:121 (+) Transcript_2380:2-364(+)